jgi:hypothetical protein
VLGALGKLPVSFSTLANGIILCSLASNAVMLFVVPSNLAGEEEATLHRDEAASGIPLVRFDPVVW